MSDQVPEPSNSPDVRKIRELVRLMHRFDLTAIDLSSEQTSIRIRRGRSVVAAPAVAAAPGMQIPVAPIAVSPVAAPVGLAPAGTVTEPTFIRSPMVGTFYESPAPDAKPYLVVGDTVRIDSTVCLIEAMKVFTEINAGLSGKIVEILAKNGQPVEFDQPLFRVEPS